jgi:hypothetical protein
MQVAFNNKLGSRNIQHLNLLVAEVQGQTLIFPFEGKTIPGVAQIISTRSEKNGKWSFTEWTVELSDGIRSFVWYQDWNEGRYVTAGTWARAVEDVRKLANVHEGHPDLDPVSIARFIRAKLPKVAARLDEAQEVSSTDPTEALLDLLKAQDELATARQDETAVKDEILRMEEAETMRKEAQETRERVGKAKEAMQKGASLADLKTLMGLG